MDFGNPCACVVVGKYGYVLVFQYLNINTLEYICI